jgi:hypothetical protein
MTRLECFRTPYGYEDIRYSICVSEVTKEQLETIINGWLVLDDGQFDMWPDHAKLYARKINLDMVRYFSASKKINDDRLRYCFTLPDGTHRYYVKENVLWIK